MSSSQIVVDERSVEISRCIWKLEPTPPAAVQVLNSRATHPPWPKVGAGTVCNKESYTMTFPAVGVPTLMDQIRMRKETVPVEAALVPK
jgi:hypothetical protein